MFARAVQVAQGFTRPLIVSTRLADGTVASGCAAFVVVNDDGWIVTAGHVMSELVAYRQQSAALSDPADLARITNVSYWWGKDGVTVAELTVDGLADLAVGRLEPFDRREVLSYPTFGNSARPLLPGTAPLPAGVPLPCDRGHLCRGHRPVPAG
jgi:hypothetical protein